MTAPRPVRRILAQAGANRIEHDIARELHEVGVRLHEDRLVAPLKNVTDAAIAAIDRLRIHPVELPHAARQVGFGSLHDNMVVVAHLAPRMAAPVEALADLAEEIEPRPPVDVITIDHLAPVTARRHVVHTARKLYSQRPRHDARPLKGEPELCVRHF